MHGMHLSKTFFDNPATPLMPMRLTKLIHLPGCLRRRQQNCGWDADVKGHAQDVMKQIHFAVTEHRDEQ